MKMMFDYARVEQIHSIAQCPDKWAYPLHLLLSLKQIDVGQDLSIPATSSLFNYHEHATEIIPGREYATQL